MLKVFFRYFYYFRLFCQMKTCFKIVLTHEILDSHVASGLDQSLDHVEVPGRGRQVQGGLPILVYHNWNT